MLKSSSVPKTTWKIVFVWLSKLLNMILVIWSYFGPFFVLMGKIPLFKKQFFKISCVFAPYILFPADCNLNFPSLFGLTAFITNPCWCVNLKSIQILATLKISKSLELRQKIITLHQDFD